MYYSIKENRDENMSTQLVLAMESSTKIAGNTECSHYATRTCAFPDCKFQHGKFDDRGICVGCHDARATNEYCGRCYYARKEEREVQKQRDYQERQAQKQEAYEAQKLKNKALYEERQKEKQVQVNLAYQRNQCRECQGQRIPFPEDEAARPEMYCPKCDEPKPCATKFCERRTCQSECGACKEKHAGYTVTRCRNCNVRVLPGTFCLCAS